MRLALDETQRALCREVAEVLAVGVPYGRAAGLVGVVAGAEGELGLFVVEADAPGLSWTDERAGQRRRGLRSRAGAAGAGGGARP